MTFRSSPLEIIDLMKAYAPACILGAAAELDVFSVLAKQPMSAGELASALDIDPRGASVLLDALAALGFLRKRSVAYRVPRDVAECMSETSRSSVLAVVRHEANRLRRWGELARAVKTGVCAEQRPSVRTPEGDRRSFVDTMNCIGESAAPVLMEGLRKLRFRHLLDVGGGAGVWTIAFLKAFPECSATLFDCPAAIALAKEQIAEAGLADRVHLVAGDYATDELPKGADCAWISAVTHLHSRDENRALFGKVCRSLQDRGVLLVRDVVMNPSRVTPAEGALFAVNMLLSTNAGRCYTLAEYREDIEQAGFGGVRLLRRDRFMNSIIEARKPDRRDCGQRSPATGGR